MNYYCQTYGNGTSCTGKNDNDNFCTYVKVVAGGFTDEMREKLENIEDYANNYQLPIATPDTLGGFKVGEGLKMSEDGTLSIDPDETCDCGDTQILDGGAADGFDSYDEIQYLDGGDADGEWD